MMGYFVEDLTHKGKIQEAKGILMRNQVEGYIRQDIKERLADVLYEESKDTSLQVKDSFTPMSQPIENYLQLPEEVKVNWIGTEEDVPKLAILLDDEFIGVDSEWRP